MDWNEVLKDIVSGTILLAIGGIGGWFGGVIKGKKQSSMEHEECRINTDEPICFNRFINYIIKSFYPGWKVEFKEYDYINFKYDKPKHKITYNNRTKIMIE